MAELRLGNPGDLCVDLGPVIDGEAQNAIERYLGAQPTRHVVRLPLPVGQEVDAGSHATFVAPAIVELSALEPDQREVFGPVLHVLRWRRSELAALTDAINATGYGLTLGIHSRIDETIDSIVARARVGNIYVNRNMIGAVVGVQPFGGEGRSGTGPKAGGPWYLPRLRRAAAPPSLSASALRQAAKVPAPLLRLRDWARRSGHGAIAARCDTYARETLLGAQVDLPGPTGESNSLSWHARGRALCLARAEGALLAQLAAVLASGNEAIIPDDMRFDPLCATLRDAVALPLTRAHAPVDVACELVLHDADAPTLADVRKSIAAREGARVRVVPAEFEREGESDGPDARPAPGAATMLTGARLAYYPLFLLLVERTVSVNTAAAGGNATLMTLAPG